VGAKGSRFDLLLATLYFKGRLPERLHMAEVEALRSSGLARPIPVLVGHTAQSYPVVGTTRDYLSFWKLRVASGTPPLMLGDAILGATVARRLGLRPGDRITSDQEKVYDISAGYPLRMRITGVLEESHGPDDLAVFVDIKTAWVIEGIGHGHAAGTAVAPSQLITRTQDNVVMSDAVPQYTEITPENIDSFHFHGSKADFPVSAIIAVPESAKAATLLKGRYSVSSQAQILEPSRVIDEMLGLVFRMKAFFDANLATVTAATVLFLVLIVLLGLRIRKREIDTLFKIGCARGTVFRLQATELLLVLVAGSILASCLAALVFWYVVSHHVLL
jgi:putative ABC transport system permease protein